MVLAHNILEKDRTKDIHISRDVTFESMLLSSQTLKGLKGSGFYRPSPVQLLGIPLGKCGFDLLLEAKSGTGKTAVFSVIALEKIDLRKSVQVIILAPTREIASQICDVLRQIGSQYEGLCVELVIGGLPVQDDINKFSKNKIHIVVGSPGRLKHLISDNHIDISAVRLLVLDEADKLMEKSFLSDIKYIHSILPKQKQVIMSSATYPENSKEFIDSFVYSAQHICPNSNSVLLGVVQKITCVQYNSNIVKQTQHRYNELVKILTQIQFKQCLMFCNYQTRVAELQKFLTKNKWPAEQLHGQQDQIDRLDALKTLQEYKCRILVSTDLASRGIDASNIDLVINFEPPNEWQTYLHRIGRAGRYGTYGTAITILSEGTEKKKFLRLIQSLNAPINDLWNNEEFVGQEHTEINNTENRLVKEIKPSNQSELWKTICPDETNSKLEDVEDFDQLCKSFITLKSDTETQNIESYSDLLYSYETDKISLKNNLDYRCLPIPTNPVENLTISKHLSTTANNDLYDFAINEKSFPNNKGKIDKIKKQSQEITNMNTDTIIKINGNSCLKNDHEYKTLRIDVNGDKSSDRVVENTNDDNKMRISKTCKLTCFNNDLDYNELGLPTAFISAKDKRKKEKFRKPVNQNHNEHHEPIKLWNFQHKNKSYTDKNNSSCDSSNNDDYISNNQVVKKSTISSKIGNKSNIEKPTRSNPKKTHISEIQHYSNTLGSSCIRDYNKSYYNWYNQLKLRVKQVEICTYIKELSEL